MKRYSSEINEKIKENEIILYPAGRCAMMVYKILKKNNIKISFFCDKEKKEDIDGIKVIDTNELVNKHKNANVVICTVGHYIELMKLLNENSFRNVYDISNLINKDDVDEEDWQIMKQYKDTMDFYSGRKVIIPNLDLVITERCSLKCENCSNLMQYYKSPRDYTVNEIMEPLYNILSKVDSIGEIRIIGGEPFMNKNMYKIIELCALQEKIENIMVLTNATIIPNEATIKVLNNPKVIVYISDYGEKSINVNNILKIFKENNIKYKHNIDLLWRRFPRFQQRNYSIEKLKDIYLKCCCKQLFVLQKDKFYACPFLSNANNLVELKEDNYVDCSIDDDLGERIRDFIINRKYFTGCAYCDGRTGEEKEICAANQISKPLEIINN